MPGVPVALRMSGHLLLGLAKIYQLQVNYLYVDCNSVISKIKQVRCFVATYVRLHVTPPPGPPSACFTHACNHTHIWQIMQTATVTRISSHCTSPLVALLDVDV